jgi:hypothetical protein
MSSALGKLKIAFRSIKTSCIYRNIKKIVIDLLLDNTERAV